MRLTSRYLWLEPINNARRRLVEFAVRVRRNALLRGCEDVGVVNSGQLVGRGDVFDPGQTAAGALADREYGRDPETFGWPLGLWMGSTGCAMAFLQAT